MTVSLVIRGGKIVDPDGIDPDDDLDYEIDLTTYLTGIADTLAAMPTGLTVSGTNCTAYNPSIVGMKVRGWVKEAVAGEQAIITFHVATVGNRKFDRSIYIKVKDK